MYLKQYEEETALFVGCCDVSESMRYSSAGVSKFITPAWWRRRLAYLTLRQQDSGLWLRSTIAWAQFLRPSQPSHLKRWCIMSLARRKHTARAIFHELAERISHRAIVVVLSDFEGTSCG